MYGIYAYIGVVLVVNVGIYGIHGVSGSCSTNIDLPTPSSQPGWARLARPAQAQPLGRRRSSRPGNPRGSSAG